MHLLNSIDSHLIRALARMRRPLVPLGRLCDLLCAGARTAPLQRCLHLQGELRLQLLHAQAGDFGGIAGKHAHETVVAAGHKVPIYKSKRVEIESEDLGNNCNDRSQVQIPLKLSLH